jgi:hypothetical protein
MISRNELLDLTGTRTFNPSVVQPVASHYTESDTAAFNNASFKNKNYEVLNCQFNAVKVLSSDLIYDRLIYKTKIYFPQQFLGNNSIIKYNRNISYSSKVKA